MTRHLAHPEKVHGCMHVGEIGRYLELSLSAPLHTRTDGCRLAPHEVELGL